MVMVDNYIFGSHSWLFGNWWVNEVEDDKTEMARKYMKIIPDGGALLKGWDIMQPQDVAHTSFEKPWETRPSKEDSFWEQLQLQLQNRKNREIEGAVGSKLFQHHHLAVCERVPKSSYHLCHLNHRYSKLVLWASSRQPGAGHGDGQAHLLLHPFCNPKWPNIPWGCETTSDRRDLCARVWSAKLLHIKARTKLEDLLGEVDYFAYSIEWQKKKVRWR